MALTICPLLLLLCTLILPPFKQIYDTIFEQLFFVIIFLLPCCGVGGIFKFTSVSRSKKFVYSMLYVLVMIIPVGLTAILIGCTWAGACF